MVAQNPVGAVIAFIVFAAIGLLLYRSSFDLTSFVEGQRGTVITVFTLFVASLVAFGMYSMNATTVEMKEGTHRTESSLQKRERRLESRCAWLACCCIS
jgi:hypothetical protein